MSRCSSCGNDWPAQLSVCPQDGTALVSAALQSAAGGAVAQPKVIADEISLEPGTTVGEYRIEAKIGQGGMAEIYTAVQPLIGKRVAIKVITPGGGGDEASVLRFIQEARAVVQIGHPNIIDVFSFGQLPDGRTYFVMEWLPGETLAARIARGTLPALEAIEIIDQIGDALEAAHEKSIIHRDLKPENVFLVSGRGRQTVKLLDFGIAKLHGNAQAAADFNLARTKDDRIMGTPQYMSPEQARGREVDGRSDAYSLGVIAFEMVTGRLPFLADNAMDMMRQHITDVPPRARMLAPEVPKALDEVIAGLLEKDAARRPSLSVVRQRLAAQRALELTGEIRLPRRRRWIALLAAGAAIAAGLAFVIMRRSMHTPVPFVIQTPLAPPPKVEPVEPPAPQRAFLQITIDAPNARVDLDGQTVAQSVQEARIPIDQPGEHELLATAPGRKPFKKTIVAVAGATIETTVHLEPLRSGARKPAATPKGKDYVIDPFGRAR